MRILLVLLCQLQYEITNSLATQRRRSFLLPWRQSDRHLQGDNGASALNVLGWSEEVRNEENKTYQVRLGWKSETNQQALLVDLPFIKDADSLASSLWPGGLAGAILCRSPVLRDLFSGSHVLELGCGLALGGLAAAANDAKSVRLTDNDSGVVELLRELVERGRVGGTAANHPPVRVETLDWRDDFSKVAEENSEDQVNVILSMDVAYYYYLLRPLMDTARAHLRSNNSLWFCVGQANRESQWDLYHNLKYGCYNQLTDEHEAAWPGSIQTCLYTLRMYNWHSCDNDSENNVDGDIPIAAMIYQSPGFELDPLTDFDYISTSKDEEGLTMSF